MSKGTQETEIKLALKNARSGRKMLRDAGFQVSRKRVFEANTILDTPEKSLRGRSCLLRLREAGLVSTVTYKGVPEVGRHKSREELEVRVTDASAMLAIAARLGYTRVFRYEKYRTEFQQPGKAGVAMLDETPVGVFLELEGTPAWIDRTARRLGFDERDYVTSSYGRVYLEWCAANGRMPRDMTFES
ncbi:MAG: class IV adenylate cyclase [Candidatus Solibacter sp.]